jgi:hypothetical protein
MAAQLATSQDELSSVSKVSKVPFCSRSSSYRSPRNASCCVFTTVHMYIQGDF